MHQAHMLSLDGRFSPLSLPPADTAPAGVSAAIERYNALKRDRKAAWARHRDLAEKSQERHADEKDAQAAADGRPATHRTKLAKDREAARLAVAGLEVQLDRCLGDLLDALADERDTWMQTLAKEQDDARQKINEALAVVEEQGTRLTAAQGDAAWLADFPQRVKYGEQPQPLPAELATPLSTLQRYTQGEITLAEIGLHPPSHVAA